MLGSYIVLKMVVVKALEIKKEIFSIFAYQKTIKISEIFPKQHPKLLSFHLNCSKNK